MVYVSESLRRKKGCMKRPKLLVIIRHAESARNKAKGGSVYFPDDEARRGVKGIPDYLIPLTEQGHEQARKTGAYLCNRFGKFDYYYHSGYTRTIETLDGILSAYPEKHRRKARVRQNAFLRERDAGYAYDMTTEEANAAFPWLAEYWKTFGGFFARPPGGESLFDVAVREYLFINMLFRDRAGQNILAVTHGGTIRCLRFLMEHWTYDQALKWPQGESPHNCGITVYEYCRKQKRMILKEYNTLCE